MLTKGKRKKNVEILHLSPSREEHLDQKQFLLNPFINGQYEDWERKSESKSHYTSINNSYIMKGQPNIYKASSSTNSNYTCKPSKCSKSDNYEWSIKEDSVDLYPFYQSRKEYDRNLSNNKIKNKESVIEGCSSSLHYAKNIASDSFSNDGIVNKHILHTNQKESDSSIKYFNDHSLQRIKNSLKNKDIQDWMTSNSTEMMSNEQMFDHTLKVHDLISLKEKFDELQINKKLHKEIEFTLKEILMHLFFLEAKEFININELEDSKESLHENEVSSAIPIEVKNYNMDLKESIDEDKMNAISIATFKNKLNKNDIKNLIKEIIVHENCLSVDDILEYKNEIPDRNKCCEFMSDLTSINLEDKTNNKNLKNKSTIQLSERKAKMKQQNRKSNNQSIISKKPFIAKQYFCTERSTEKISLIKIRETERLSSYKEEYLAMASVYQSKHQIYAESISVSEFFLIHVISSQIFVSQKQLLHKCQINSEKIRTEKYQKYKQNKRNVFQKPTSVDKCTAYIILEEPEKVHKQEYDLETCYKNKLMRKKTMEKLLRKRHIFNMDYDINDNIDWLAVGMAHSDTLPS
ncbi:uncharacterized protein LOC111617903 [Centruroides sculpturatus]|uniref:uncharacterized protein LOC111617903 n=1 Tax=Centruroides sculpturatus TaxID=218467 RepID=UPI000C6E4A67|nr:uncharacterized protein LOC111617903 [Centruroides sculpturatus]